MPRTTGKKQKIKKSNNKYYVVAPNGREIPVPETVTVNRDEELAIDTESSSYVVEVGAGAVAKWLAGQAIGRLAGALPSILFSPARGGEHFVDKTLDDGKRVMYIIGVK